MTSSVSNLVDNITERIHKIECKYRHIFLDYESVKDSLVKYKCLKQNYLPLKYI